MKKEIFIAMKNRFYDLLYEPFTCLYMDYCLILYDEYGNKKYIIAWYLGGIIRFKVKLLILSKIIKCSRFFYEFWLLQKFIYKCKYTYVCVYQCATWDSNYKSFQSINDIRDFSNEWNGKCLLLWMKLLSLLVIVIECINVNERIIR